MLALLSWKVDAGPVAGIALAWHGARRSYPGGRDAYRVSRPRLPMRRAAREVRAELGRKAFHHTHRLHPAVGDRRQVPVEMGAQRRDQRRQGRGEVLVLAHAEAQPRHVDAAPETALVGPQGRQRTALARVEQRGRGRMAALVEAPRDRLPVEAREPLLE